MATKKFWNTGVISDKIFFLPFLGKFDKAWKLSIQDESWYLFTLCSVQGNVSLSCFGQAIFEQI